MKGQARRAGTRRPFIYKRYLDHFAEREMLQQIVFQSLWTDTDDDMKLAVMYRASLCGLTHISKLFNLLHCVVPRTYRSIGGGWRPPRGSRCPAVLLGPLKWGRGSSSTPPLLCSAFARLCCGFAAGICPHGGRTRLRPETCTLADLHLHLGVYNCPWSSSRDA